MPPLPPSLTPPRGRAQVLDDLPHSRSTQSSSLLTGKAYMDNFTSLPAEEGAAVLPLFADPQVREGTAGKAWGCSSLAWSQS